jgi:hypothetical protein
MGLCPSREAANCAAIQELPNILRNPKVHCRVHKSPPLILILSQINPIHIILFYTSKIHFNIVYPHTFWSSQWSPSFRLSHQYPIRIPRLPHSCSMSCPSHPPWLDHSKYIWRRVKFMLVTIPLFTSEYRKTSLYALKEWEETEMEVDRSCTVHWVRLPSNQTANRYHTVRWDELNIYQI